MDQERIERGAAGAPGMIYKAAQMTAQEVTPEELKAINKMAMEPLDASDVFTFSAILCDNEVDRDFEHFSIKALTDLKKLFVGKPVIKDHSPRADNQVARIYATELVQSEKILPSGEPYTQLKAHCYMVRTASNADLIAEIKGGIKKEGSVGCKVASSICSICGTDNSKSYCRHFPGRKYAKESGEQLCTFKLDGAVDAYEYSLVPIPAQRKAGISKSYTGETVFEPEEPTPEPPADEMAEKAHELTLRARLAGVRVEDKN